MARKRKNGQGTVRLRSDGRWEGRHIVGYDENGKAKQKSVLAKTKAECVEKLKKLQEEYTEVAPFKVKPDMRFGDWMNYWYENHCKPSIRPTTQKGYEEWIYVHAIPGLGHIPLNKLTQADCQKFLNEMKANGRKTHRDTKGPEMAERSVRSCYHVIRMALDRAVKDGLIKKNPILGVKLPPPEPKEMKVLSKEEIQRFLIQAKAEGMYELFLLELTTGLRRGEILALTWDDLNFETGELHISKQVTPVGGKNIISEPKTKAAFRTIILPPVMVGLLREYRKEVFSPLMFPSRIKPNQPIDPSYVRKRLQQILERADCKKVRFHDLRHTFATMSLEHGMDVKTLSAIIGHVSAKTTLRISTPTLPTKCRKMPQPASTAASQRQKYPDRKQKLHQRRRGLNRTHRRAADPARATSSSSRRICGRDGTRPSGQTARSTPAMYMAARGRNVRKSWRS